MNPAIDDQDRQVDRNLRTIGRHLKLPAPPTARQRESWRSAHAHAAGQRPNERKGLSVNQRRFLGLGSAAAAALILGLLFVGPMTPRPVQAATIFRSLKTTTWQGLRMTLERVKAEGLHVDGQFEVRFKEPVSLARLVHECDAMDDPHGLFDSAFMQLAVRADDSAEADVAGLELEARGGFAHEQGWVYVQISSLPARLIEEEPMVAAIGGLLQNGVLLDLSGLQRALSSLELGEDNAKVQVEIHKEIENSIHEAMSDVHEEMADLHPVHAGAKVAQGQVGLELHADADAELQGLIQALLSGTATGEQLQALAAKLEQEAGDVSVVHSGDGVYVLRASGFDQDDPMVQDAVVEIQYRDAAGVESVDIAHIGEGDGHISIAFAADLPQRSDAERNKLLEQGVLRIDVGSLVGTLAAFAK